MALRRLRLDQVWLLVSPGNPLKRPDGMATLAERLAAAAAIGDGRRVVATAVERALGTRFTADTLAALRRRFPRVRFVWLMGADILAELPRWRRWTDVTHTVPFAVVPRPGYNHRALAGQAARRGHAARHLARQAPVLAGLSPPAWTFLPAPQNAISATALRAAYSGAAPRSAGAGRSHANPPPPTRGPSRLPSDGRPNR